MYIIRVTQSLELRLAIIVRIIATMDKGVVVIASNMAEVGEKKKKVVISTTNLSTNLKLIP